MDLERNRVLIAEDNAGLGRALEFTFRQAGFEVTLCRDGADAWETLQRAQFDVVLMDHEMPRLTGLGLCCRMRASVEHAKTPIVMVTGREMEMDTRELQDELQLTAICPKPYSPRALVNLVREIVRARAAHLSAS